MACWLAACGSYVAVSRFGACSRCGGVQGGCVFLVWGGAHCRGGSISIFQGFFANVCGVLFGDWGKRLAIILSGLEIF